MKGLNPTHSRFIYVPDMICRYGALFVIKGPVVNARNHTMLQFILRLSVVMYLGCVTGYRLFITDVAMARISARLLIYLIRCALCVHPTCTSSALARRATLHTMYMHTLRIVYSPGLTLHSVFSLLTYVSTVYTFLGNTYYISLTHLSEVVKTRQ